MALISTSDIVCATACYHGRTIASFTSTGFSSLSDVIRAVRSAIGSVVGMVELSLLNNSRGWRERRSLFIAPPAAGVQLTLF